MFEVCPNSWRHFLIGSQPGGRLFNVWELRVMTFNMWFGGHSGGQQLEQSAEVVRAARADVVGIQEGSRFPAGEFPDDAAAMAELLGWHYVAQGRNRAIMSRYPIVEQTPKRWGARVGVPNADVWVFNTHFAHAPYQPFQLLSISYANAAFLDSAEAAVAAASDARAKHAAEMLEEIRAASAEATVFVTGDFNEPSSLDWTSAAATAGLCPMAVEWPTANLFYENGFVDTFRHVHPDPVTSPGCTWTCTTAPDDPNDHHDRIDFVLCRGGAGLRIVSSEIVGENAAFSDIVVSPYPSDHRTLVSEIHMLT